MANQFSMSIILRAVDRVGPGIKSMGRQVALAGAKAKAVSTSIGRNVGDLGRLASIGQGGIARAYTGVNKTMMNTVGMAKGAAADMGMSMQRIRKGAGDLGRRFKNTGFTIRKAFQRMGSDSGKLANKMKTDFAAMGMSLTIGLSLPLAIISGLALKGVNAFEEAMNKVRGVALDASQKELKDLQDRVMQLGAETQFTATQAAVAAGFLVRAGVKIKDIIRMLPDVLGLAAAADIEVGQAADYLVKSLKALGLGMNQTSRMVDMLANAANMSVGDLDEFAQAIFYTGQVATKMGTSPDSLLALLSVLHDVGIAGSHAGTSMRRMIIDTIKKAPLLAKVLQNTLGELRPIEEVIADLDKRGIGIRGLTKLFETRAIPGVLAIMEKIPEFKGIVAEINRLGTAAAMLGERMKGFPGMFNRLKATWLSLTVAVFRSNFGKLVENAGRGIANLMEAMSKVNPKLHSFAGFMILFAIVIPPVIVLLGILKKAMISLHIASGKFVITLLLIAANIAILSSSKMGSNFGKGVIKGVKEMNPLLKEAVRQFWAQSKVIPIVGEKIKWLSEHAKEVGEWVGKALVAIPTTLLNVITTMIGSFNHLVEDIKVEFVELTNVIIKAINKLIYTLTLAKKFLVGWGSISAAEMLAVSKETIGLLDVPKKMISHRVAMNLKQATPWNVVGQAIRLNVNINNEIDTTAKKSRTSVGKSGPSAAVSVISAKVRTMYDLHNTGVDHGLVLQGAY